MAEFVIEERAEPPKAYIDSLEKSKTLEFVTYTTKIVCNENGSEKMTEQEAIEKLNELLTMCDFKDEYGEFTDTEPYEKSVDMAIQALETMQELKKRNMTVEDLENYMQFEDECVKKRFSFNSLLEGLEKQIPKKPIYSRLYATTPDMNCPVCNATLLTDEPNYCKRCGQKFNWGDEEE